MPTTVPYGISFPCLGPAIQVSDFYNYAATTEAALSTVNALTPQLLQREFVKAGAILPNQAVNTVGTASWITPTTANNPNGMFNPGSPTVFTLQSSGSFLVDLHVANLDFPTTLTSARGAVLLNGVEQIWGKMGGPSSAGSIQFFVSGLIVSATAGQQISATWLWTGTGGPARPLYDIQICKISDL